MAKKLIESGRAKNEFERVDVKLHMTLMNSRYLAQVGLTSEERMKGGIVCLQKEGNGNREKFDATAILEKYKDYEFGRLTVEEVSEIFLQK